MLPTLIDKSIYGYIQPGGFGRAKGNRYRSGYSPNVQLVKCSRSLATIPS